MPPCVCCVACTAPTTAWHGRPHLQVMDPVRASYGVDNALYAVGQLAQTTMRSELGKITLDKTFEEREALNANIVRSINEAADAWGLLCLRCEPGRARPCACSVKPGRMQAQIHRHICRLKVLNVGASLGNVTSHHPLPCLCCPAPASQSL